MSNSQNNEITIFLRPANSQPYVIKKCANWLHSLGKAKSAEDAFRYLIWLEVHNPATFRYLVSEYHRTHTFKTGYLVEPDHSKSFRSSKGSYGEEAHMYL